MECIRKCKSVLWLCAVTLAFATVFGGASVTAQAKTGKSTTGKSTTVKSVSLKIGKTNVTKKTYKLKQGGKKKLTVTVSPKTVKRTVTFASGNKKVATVSKSGVITAKKAGTAKIKVTVKSGKVKKITWMKVKVTKPVAKKTSAKKSIVIYFSCTDNTKRIAGYVAESAGADIYRIKAATPYTSEDLDYDNDDSRTSREQNDDSARPKISGSLPNLKNYDVIYLGYPIWWGEAPKIMYTFVEKCNLSGKKVVPFCTSASSGIGTSATNLKAVDSHKAKWLAGRRFSGSSSKSSVKKWVSGLEVSGSK